MATLIDSILIPLDLKNYEKKLMHDHVQIFKNPEVSNCSQSRWPSNRPFANWRHAGIPEHHPGSNSTGTSGGLVGRAAKINRLLGVIRNRSVALVSMVTSFWEQSLFWKSFAFRSFQDFSTWHISSFRVKLLRVANVVVVFVSVRWSVTRCWHTARPSCYRTVWWTAPIAAW